MNFLELFKKLRQQIVDLWERTDKKDRTRFFMISGVALVIIVAAVFMLNKSTYVMLRYDMDQETTGALSAALTAESIPSRIGDGGTSISVPDKQLDKASVVVATSGVVKSGKSYDIFALGSGLTSSDYSERRYDQLQIEDNLSSLIVQHILPVEKADVMMSIPQKTVIYASEAVPSTASVWLTMKKNETATPELVKAVQVLVGNGTGIDPDNVAVVNQDGRLLNYDKEDTYNSLTTAHDFEKQFSYDLDNSVTALLSAVVGYDHLKVKSNVILDYAKKETRNTFFSPMDGSDLGVPISMQTISEKASGNIGAVGEPGVDENGGADTYTEVDTTNANQYEKISETTNYEVNKSEELITKAAYEIEQITISVIIDSTNLSKDNSNTDTIKQIVGGAIGLKKADYDCITVSINPFDGSTQDAAIREKLDKDKSRAELFELIKVLALYIVIGVCIILIAVRSLALFRRKPSPAEQTAIEALASVEAEIDEYGELVKLATAGEQIEITKSPTRERVEEFIENNPDAVANLLRNWLSDESNERRR